MSIFKKDCPECAKPNAVDAVHCACGYCFDPEALAGADAAEYQEEQDRLYRDYLAARIVQAEVELTVAREHAHHEPGNTYKAAAALVAEQALNALQAEMKQYQLRAPAKIKRATPKPASAAVVKPAPAAPALRFAARAAQMLPHRTLGKKQTPTPPETKPMAPKIAGTALTPQRVPVSLQPKPPAATASKPVMASAAKTQGTEPMTAKRVVPPAAIKTPALIQAAAPAPARPKTTAVPTTRFRQLQAKKADAITKKSPIAASSSAASCDSATQHCPSCTATVSLHLARCSCGYTFSQSSDVPALSLESTDALLPAAQEAVQECPNCTATLSANRKQCNCGYTFSQATEQVPALSLDATALAILTGGVGANRTSRRR